VRGWKALAGRNDTVLGIAAAVDKGAHRVARPPSSHGVSPRDDDTGDFETGNIAGTRRWRVTSLSLHHIRAVDPSRSNLDQDLFRFRSRYRP
jgi:hypothetical protein